MPHNACVLVSLSLPLRLPLVASTFSLLEATPSRPIRSTLAPSGTLITPANAKPVVFSDALIRPNPGMKTAPVVAPMS